MSELIARYFDRLAGREDAVLTDLSGGLRRSVTGRDLPDLTDRVAGWLAAQGVQRGDRVVAVFDNRLEAALLLLAALRHGITLCLQPANAEAQALADLAAGLGARAIISAATPCPEGATPLTLEAAAASPAHPAPDLAPQTPFTLTFTSGSTGAPKGILHAAESFLGCAAAFNRQTGIGAGDRFLNVMPMYYMAGIFNGLLAPLAAGASVVIDAAFGTPTALRFWPRVAEEGITALWLSPTMLSLVMRLDRGDKVLPAGFRRLFVGTGAMAARDAQAFLDSYGMAPLQSYGLSELLYISVDDPGQPHFGSVGRPLDGVRVHLDADGRLGFSTPHAFLGYLVEGALIPPEPVFATSDLGALEDGILSILGRSDDIILRGGVNVNPIEIERALAPLFKGRGFCVTGLPDATLGQKVVLVFEGATARPEDDEIWARARQIVAQGPGRAQLDARAQIAALPLGPTGKIRRAALRETLAAAEGAA
ncbi:class I adenylate-forming enzyme family protein [Phaeovulum vinaykumarii]|uniref:Long-chain acyl-CoA synthetase n=1 Tax=Phaeovulum vinaykumarii TaxID=407234 RepID=A0A1N7JWL6_9RHOB|nr:long-chain fatty acid--CoA ligase [Phaeovulum vinaykumarii]SIS53717.1 long-chain acyl-CoA synthetase [Phaeovulum vinaykumarii]SOB91691.1 acyl-CoA synthetase (AMP-forming)/AMP-acid ligase II [Phaeovulum vinaykumarii]